MKHERPLKVLTVAALVLGAAAVALGGFLLHKGAAVHAIAAIVLGGVEMLLCVLELLCIKKLEGEIVESREYALRTDGMTGIRNRFGYYHDGRKLLLRNIETPYSVVDLDVDHFTNLNILYGYDKGDAMLKSLAACMESACGEGECCGRIEGDHFALLIRRTTRQEDTARIEKMIAVARSTASYPLRLCVGVYEIENNIEAIEYVTDCAVAARLKVKRDNGAGIAFYDYAIHQQEITSNELVDRMEDALRDGEFCAYYQPIYDLQRNCVCAAEALVRWIDHDGRFMPPDKFIHLFERNGLIMQLDFYVLEEVCRMQSEVLKLGLDPVPIAVNFSRAHLYEKDLIPKIAALLDKYCIAHWMVDIELTESMLNTDQELMLQTASALSAAGYSVSMDDFGSGVSSLNLLKNIQLDKVKLDREFLVQCDTDARGRTVVRSVLKMAQQLKLKTVAEGVETEEQLEFLREAGCDMVQGYLLARPMPADRFRDVIEDAQKKSYHIKAPRAVRRADTEE